MSCLEWFIFANNTFDNLRYTLLEILLKIVETGSIVLRRPVPTIFTNIYRNDILGYQNVLVYNHTQTTRIYAVNIQYAPLNRVTSGPGYFDPIKRNLKVLTRLTGGSIKRSILYIH